MTISEECREDWSYGEDTIRYDRLDKDLGAVAFGLLNELSQDITIMQADEHGWTELDYLALGSITELEWLERLIVPPVSTSEQSRIAFTQRMAGVHQALPFSEAERHWLFDDPDNKAWAAQFQIIWRIRVLSARAKHTLFRPDCTAWYTDGSSCNAGGHGDENPAIM